MDYRIRGEGSWWACFTQQHIIDFPTNASRDFPEFFRRMLGFNDRIRTAPRTTRLSDETEENLRLAIAKGVRLVRAECSDERETVRSIFDLRFTQNALAWMRIGYRHACRVYKHDPYSLASFFDQMAKAADKHLKHAEQGEELTVRINRRQLEFTMELKYPLC